jgi:AcrR family transcriptional regulator
MATADDDRAAAARAERRQQILRAAKEVFAEAGYHEASINAIIERARIARGTFYLYFTSKAAVFDALLDQAMGDLRARIKRIDIEDPAAPPPQVQLRQGLVRVLDYILGDRQLATILLAGEKAPEAEASARAKAFFAEVRDVIRRALTHGIDMGLVRRCNVEVAAAALLGTVRGMIEHLLATDAPPPLDELVNELIAVALRGVLASHAG